MDATHHTGLNGHTPLLIVANLVALIAMLAAPHVGDIAAMLSIAVNLVALYRILFK